MCYYSTSLSRHQVRDAKEGEDLTLREDNYGHHLPTASDGKVVCMAHGNEVHIASFQLSGSAPRGLRFNLAHLIGQPVSARFIEHGHSHGYAADCIVLDGYHEVHLLYLAPGVTFYTGPKRSDVADKLGVNDRSITLDHMPDPKEGEADAPSSEPPAEPATEPQVNPVKEEPATAPREAVTA